MPRGGTHVSIQSRLGLKRPSQTAAPNLGGYDARNKIKKLRLEDARQKIEQKSGAVGVQDLRLKVNNLRAKNFDAREKIKQKRRLESTPDLMSISQSQTKVVVTGLGKSLTSLRHSSGQGVTKTIRNNISTGRFTRIASANGKLQIVSKTFGQSAAPGVRSPPLVRPTLIEVKNDLYSPPTPPTRLAVVKRPAQPKKPSPRAQPLVDNEEDGDVVMDEWEDEEEEEEEEVERLPLKMKSFKTTVRQQDSETDEAASCRIKITNLHPGVTEDDILELFGAVGPMKLARLLKPGVAEVMFQSRSSAQLACRRYHMRELDGQPMHVVALKLDPIASAPSVRKVRGSAPIVRKVPGSAPIVRKVPGSGPIIRKVPGGTSATGSAATVTATIAARSVGREGDRSDQVMRSRSGTAGILRGTGGLTEHRGVRPGRDSEDDQEDEDEDSEETKYEPLRLSQPSGKGVKALDIAALHRALFKVGPSTEQAGQPVAFVVKI